MNSISKISAVAVLAASLLLSSCGKYEEGPKISLASKKGRLTREWIFQKSIDGSTGNEYICNSGCMIMELKKDGGIVLNGTSWSGYTWQLSSNKEKLETVTTIGGSSSTESEIILRLTSKELWLKDESSGDQVHYVAN